MTSPYRQKQEPAYDFSYLDIRDSWHVLEEMTRAKDFDTTEARALVRHAARKGPEVGFTYLLEIADKKPDHAERIFRLDPALWELEELVHFSRRRKASTQAWAGRKKHPTAYHPALLPLTLPLARLHRPWRWTKKNVKDPSPAEGLLFMMLATSATIVALGSSPGTNLGIALCCLSFADAVMPSKKRVLKTSHVVGTSLLGLVGAALTLVHGTAIGLKMAATSGYKATASAYNKRKNSAALSTGKAPSPPVPQPEEPRNPKLRIAPGRAVATFTAAKRRVAEGDVVDAEFENVPVPHKTVRR